jgi:hypothetical protein
VSDCVDLPANLAVRRHTSWRRSVLVLVIAVGGCSPRRAHAREDGLGLVRRHARLPAHNQYPGLDHGSLTSLLKNCSLRACPYCCHSRFRKPVAGRRWSRLAVGGLRVRTGGHTASYDEETRTVGGVWRAQAAPAGEGWMDRRGTTGTCHLWFVPPAAVPGAGRCRWPRSAERAQTGRQTRHRACPVPDSRSVPTQKGFQTAPTHVRATHPPTGPASQCSHGRDARNGRAVAIVAAPDTSQTPPRPRRAPPRPSNQCQRPQFGRLRRGSTVFSPHLRSSARWAPTGTSRPASLARARPLPHVESGLGTSTPAPERRLRILPSSGASLHISTSHAHEPRSFFSRFFKKSEVELDG